MRGSFPLPAMAMMKQLVAVLLSHREKIVNLDKRKQLLLVGTRELLLCPGHQGRRTWRVGNLSEGDLRVLCCFLPSGNLLNPKLPWVRAHHSTGKTPTKRQRRHLLLGKFLGLGKIHGARLTNQAILEKSESQGKERQTKVRPTLGGFLP